MENYRLFLKTQKYETLAEYIRMEEKEIAYQITNTYSTMNTLTKNTKNVWFACHGIGFLSRYFIKYFDTLNPEENYIIAPQASSKYYLKKRIQTCRCKLVNA